MDSVRTNGARKHRALGSRDGGGNALKVASAAVNQLVDRLRIVSSEVNRISREVGAEGKLGGQADAPQKVLGD